MRTPSTVLRLLAALLALALVAAACGDDDDDDGTDETTQEDTGADTGGDGAATDTGGDEDGNEPDGEAASGDLPDEFFSEDCQQAYDSFLAANTQMGSAFTGQTGDIDEAKASIEALADNAPDEIADAFETFATEMGVFFDALADIGFDGSSQPTAEQMSQLMQISETVDEEALEQSADEISAYFDEVCGTTP